jgi:transposase, IS5 family
MFLKFRYRLGYESLCAEVSDSISWRRFCRIPLDGKVPHPTTLMKLTTRCGEAAVAGLNKALLAKAAGQKLLRTARLRADTMVIPANVAYPTDSGLLARAVGKMARAVRRVQAAGGATRTRAKLGREETTWVIARGAGGPGRDGRGRGRRGAAQRAPGPARALSGRILGRLRRALDELAVTIARAATIVAQTRSRLAGQLPDSATRLVSLHDCDARPIRKGRLDRPVEFGYKAQVIDNDDGIVLDYSIEYGAAPDGPQLAPTVARVSRRACREPRAVTADRGYGQPAIELDLHALGVCTVAIPRRAPVSPARKTTEHSRASAGS